MLASILLLGGCSGLRLYSEARDKQGEAVKKAWADVDTKSLIASQRENLYALLQEQLKAQDRISTARRDQKIRAMVTADKASIDSVLVQPVNQQIGALAGSPQALAQWLTSRKFEADHKESMQKFAREFERFGFELPPCEDLHSGEAHEVLQGWLDSHAATTGGFVSGALKGATAQCERHHDGKAALAQATQLAPLGGRLKSQAETVAAEERAFETLRRNSLAARNTYKAALGEYAAAAAKLKVDADARAKVQQAAKKLQDALSALSRASDAFALEFLSKERRDALTAVLATVAETPAGEAPAAGSSRAAVALIVLPDLLDEARKSLAEANKPLLVPLLLRKNHEQLKLEAATRDIRAQEVFVDLARTRLDAVAEQARQLERAAQALEAISAAARSTPLPGVSKLESVEDRRRIFQALALYFDVHGRLEAEVKKIDYKRDAVTHERSLSLAEVNVLQWDSLIGTTVEQVAQFGTTGIKAEHIVGLLNSLTLLWIGAGVNR